MKKIKEELADVMNYCLQLAQVLNVDVIDIINAKMDKTEKKYVPMHIIVKCLL